MPKEIIWSKYHGTEEAPEPVAQVGWGRDASYVELGVIKPGDDPVATTNLESGWFIQLDRNGINRLIRTLRKARDAAYGADQ